MEFFSTSPRFKFLFFIMQMVDPVCLIKRYFEIFVQHIKIIHIFCAEMLALCYLILPQVDCTNSICTKSILHQVDCTNSILHQVDIAPSRLHQLDMHQVDIAPIRHAPSRLHQLDMHQVDIKSNCTNLLVLPAI